MINPAKIWFQVQQLKTKRQTKGQTWLTRYTMPEEITFDGGPEFKTEFRKPVEDKY